MTPDRWDSEDMWLQNVDVHLERMDNDSAHIAMYRDGKRIGEVSICSDRGVLHISALAE